MLADDEEIWYNNDLGDGFERTYRRAMVIGLCIMATVLTVVIAIFYIGAMLTEGLAESIMNAMLLILGLGVIGVLTLVAVHKIRWGRTVPSRVGLSDYGIRFEYKTGKRVFVSASRLLGARRVRWMGLDQVILVHWGYLPMPDGKFVTEEIAQLVVERFQLRRYRLRQSPH